MSASAPALHACTPEIPSSATPDFGTGAVREVASTTDVSDLPPYRVEIPPVPAPRVPVLVVGQLWRRGALRVERSAAPAPARRPRWPLTCAFASGAALVALTGHVAERVSLVLAVIAALVAGTVTLSVAVSNMRRASRARRRP